MFASSLSSFFEMKGGFCIDVLHYNGIVVPPQPTYIPVCIPEISENDFFFWQIQNHRPKITRNVCLKLQNFATRIFFNIYRHFINLITLFFYLL